MLNRIKNGIQIYHNVTAENPDLRLVLFIDGAIDVTIMLALLVAWVMK